MVGEAENRQYAVFLDAAVSAVSDFIYTFDLEGRFTYANPALHNLLGLKPGEMVGQDFHDLHYPFELATTLQSQIQEVISTGKPLRAETLFESASGAGYYEYIFVPLFGENGEVSSVAGTTRDITERREIEVRNLGLVAELDSERRKLTSFFEQSPAFICVLTGPDYIFEFVNGPYYQLVGHHELLGRPCFEALPDSRGQGYEELLKQVYHDGETVRGVGASLQVRRNDDGPVEELSIDFTYQPLRSPEGEVVGILVHGNDVTDRLLAEQKLADVNANLERIIEERTSQLKQSVEEMQGFTYSIAHDLRAPLRSIASTSMILLEELSPMIPEEYHVHLQRQSHNAKRLAQLIDDLLKLSRNSRRALSVKSVDITLLVKQEVEELRKANRCDRIEFDIQEEMTGYGDQEMLRLVIANLLENACKFSPNGGTVGVTANDQIFSVRDEGVGFDPAYAHKVFLPFERLVGESEFPGTGIGLANVKRVIERQGGQVWAESKPGVGSTFSFSLPMKS